MSQPIEPRPGVVFRHRGSARRVVAVRPSASGGATYVWHTAAAGVVHAESMTVAEYAAAVSS